MFKGMAGWPQQHKSTKTIESSRQQKLQDRYAQTDKRTITQTERAAPPKKVANHQKIQADFETREAVGRNPL